LVPQHHVGESIEMILLTGLPKSLPVCAWRCITPSSSYTTSLAFLMPPLE
jgi:hypothetical protein